MTRIRSVLPGRLFLKVTAAYLAVTVSAGLLVGVIIIGVLDSRWFAQIASPERFSATAARSTDTVAALWGKPDTAQAMDQILERTALDVEDLKLAEDNSTIYVPPRGMIRNASAALVTADGSVLVRWGPATSAGEDYITGRAPVLVEGRRVADLVVRAQARFDPWKDLAFQARTGLPTTAIFLLWTALLAGIFGSLVAAWIGRRLDGLSRATARWTSGDFSSRLANMSRDEIGDLGRSLNTMAEQLQSTVRLRQEVAVLQERGRLARELHDSVKQQSYAAALQTGAAKDWLDRDPSRARRHLEEAERALGLAQTELASVIHQLRRDGDRVTLAELLQDAGDDWARKGKFSVEHDLESEIVVPPAVAHEVSRIAQEALANVVRHARAGQVRLVLRRNGAEICLSVEDDGQGFDPDTTSPGEGLRSMAERAGALRRGRFDLQSAPGDGTTVTVRFASADDLQVEETAT